MKNIKQNIERAFLDSPKNVHAVIYGIKKTRKRKTGQSALIYFVEKKLPINQLSKKDLIPKSVDINGTEYLTDIVEVKRIKTTQCYDFTDPEVTFLNTKVRPISGGLEISSLCFWEQTNPYEFSFTVGTIGFFAVDNYDQKLVGVTAGHVIVKDMFLASSRNINNIHSNITEPIVFNTLNGLVGTFMPSVLQFGSLEFTVNFNESKIGVPKRYSVLNESQSNELDVALISISNGVDNNSVLSQAGLPMAFDMDFATTSEIDSLLDDETPLYSVGRTTGPKGENCPMVCVGYGESEISFVKQSIPTTIDMTDLIFYSFEDDSNLPVYDGDSGSALIGNFNGVYKIVGLVFAGDTFDDPVFGPTSTVGVACRIDKIAEKMNISPIRSFSSWSMGSENFSKIYLPLTENREFTEYENKKYFQVGSELTAQTPISFPTPTPTPSITPTHINS